jgi:CRP-like cAMP-binding protein
MSHAALQTEESFGGTTTGNAGARRPWRHLLDSHGPAHRGGGGRAFPARRFQSGFETLRGMDLFSAVSDGELVKFAALGIERCVEKGTAFFPHGRMGGPPPLALILEGEALLAWGHGPEELLLRALEPGDLLGEIQVFDGQPSAGGFEEPAMRTLTPVRLMEWDHDNVLEALRRWPDVALSLLGGMARRQRDLHRRVAGICNQRAPRRLARLLTALVEDRGVLYRDARGDRCLRVRRTPSRTRMAELAGMARETVSRLLVRWEKAGWVGECEGDLLVLDEERLWRMAGAGTRA